MAHRSLSLSQDLISSFRTLRCVVRIATALLTGACAASAPGPASPPPSDVDGCEVLQEYLRTEFRRDAPGGVVLVARGDEILVREAFGLADVESGRELRVTDALPIGSITKSFTAAAILRLVDEGALALDDDVRLHVPHAPTQGRRVTLEELLTHTSGMPNLVDRPGFEEWARSERSTEELVAQTEGMAWLFEPGRGFAYSDSGYILLGAVVERATGLPYDEHVVAEVAGPLGMHGTRSAHRADGTEPRGYSDGGPPPPMHMSVPHASGQLAATVDDLLRWVRAWESGEIASRELSELAWSKRTLPDGTVSSYGFGWKRDSLAGRDMVGHGGWVPGFTAGLVHLPEERLTAIVLTNTDTGDPEASYVARRSLRLLLTGSPHVGTIEVAPERLARLAGTYRTAAGALLEITHPGEGPPLVARWNGGRPYGLVALTPTTFAADDSDGTYRFTFEDAQEDPDGPAAAVRTSLSGEPKERAVRTP